MKLITFDVLAKSHKITVQGIRVACVRYGLKWTPSPITGPGRRKVALTVEQVETFKAKWREEHGR